MRDFMIFAVLMASIGLSSGASAADGAMAQKDVPVLNTAGPLIEVAEKEIDLGVIPADVGEIVGSIYFYNNGSEPLQVAIVRRSLNYGEDNFTGWQGRN